MIFRHILLRSLWLLAWGIALTSAGLSPIVQAETIMFISNVSVQDTNGTYGGFRGPMQDLYETQGLPVGNGMSIDFLGDFKDGPTTTEMGHVFDDDHQGYRYTLIGHLTEEPDGTCNNGHGTARQLNKNKVLENHQPDRIFLYQGAPNMLQSAATADLASSQMDALIEQIYGVLPDVSIWVSTLIPKLDGNRRNKRIQNFNSELPTIVADYASLGKDISLIDMYTAFDGHADMASLYSNDNIKPNEAGYKLMAETIFGELVVVPEPSTVLLLTMSSLALLSRQRRRSF